MSIVEKIFLYLRTIYFLKRIQIWYRLYYEVKSRINKYFGSKKLRTLKTDSKLISLLNLPNTNTSYVDDHTFMFLNLKMNFEGGIDWNHKELGKLWTYNLCYFDFLLQSSMITEDGIKLMKDFSEKYESIEEGLEPYPTSIRLINWIKFCCTTRTKDKELDNIIYSDVFRLSKNIEYHLMGNHLLENGFALLYGGIYLQSESLINQAKKILEEQIYEQILSDGAHFELSPMYHQIILSKVLDSLNLLMNSTQYNLNSLERLLTSKASLMLAWMNNVSFHGAGITKVNDSSDNITFSREEINKYASDLGVSKLSVELKDSGYRKYSRVNYEALVDIGNIGPDYIPGHAHSDTFNILLNTYQKPILVDTGISTYEKNETRQVERSTKAHNTVMINDVEQSEVWGGFRVGRRAKSVIIEEKDDYVSASHDGYDTLGIIHNRVFSFQEKSIAINDMLSNNCSAKAYFHFHPSISISIDGLSVVNFGIGRIEFNKQLNLKVDTYQYAEEFNKRVEAQVVEVSFARELSSVIIINEAN